MANTAIAVPDYERYMGIKGPYLGDLVYQKLEDEHSGEYERVDMFVKSAADGTEEVVFEGHVRDRNVYIVHPFQALPSQHLMVAAEATDNILRSDGLSVVLMEPYNPYYSYDRRKGKQSLGANIVAHAYKTAGISRIFTMDPHSDLVGLAFDVDCPLETLSMQVPLAHYFRDRYGTEDVTVCSPDIGGYKRAEVFADVLGVPLVGLRKRRSETRSDETEVLEIVGDRSHIEGKKILLRDDVVRTAGSLVEAKKVLEDAGASEFYAAVTHLSMCGPAMERIKDSGMTVVGTNTVPHDGLEEDLYDVMDISPILSEVIYRRSTGQSIGEFFRSFK